MARYIFHLVHGTQFYLLSRPRIRWLAMGKPHISWTAEESQLRSTIRERLESKGHDVGFRVVDWSGRNRHSARMEAARAIRASIAENGTEGARNILIAHSHGGNACMLALKNAESDQQATGADEPEGNAETALHRRIDGIACLSTPFLVIRKAGWAVSASFAWAAVAVFALYISIFRNFDSFLAELGLAMAAGIPLAALLLGAAKRYGGSTDWSQVPSRCEKPVLIVRSPGDEASSGLGLVAMLARTIFVLEKKAASPLTWLQQHTFLAWFGGTGLLLGVTAAMVFNPALEVWLSEYGLVLLFVVFSPLLIGYPLRLVVYALAYGPDLFGLPAFQSMSAETTPLGRWTTDLVDPPDSEQRASAHSQIYELEAVHELLVGWALSIGNEAPEED